MAIPELAEDGGWVRDPLGKVVTDHNLYLKLGPVQAETRVDACQNVLRVFDSLRPIGLLMEYFDSLEGCTYGLRSKERKTQ